MFKFEPDENVLNTYMDGGVAIIEQIICSQAKWDFYFIWNNHWLKLTKIVVVFSYFIGTSKSTFSFRIQEEREILGFSVETTFNSFCGDNDDGCTQPTKWRLVKWQCCYYVNAGVLGYVEKRLMYLCFPSYYRASIWFPNHCERTTKKFYW